MLQCEQTIEQHRYSVVQCVAVCCSVLQCEHTIEQHRNSAPIDTHQLFNTPIHALEQALATEVCSSVLQCVAVLYSVLQCERFNTPSHDLEQAVFTEVCCSALQCASVHCIALQCVAV